MTAPLKTIEGTGIAAAMADIGRRAKGGGAHARALPRRAARRGARRHGAGDPRQRGRHPRRQCRGRRRGESLRRDAAFIDRLSLDAEARRRDGGRHRDRARARRSGRRRDGKLDAAERHDDRARARAARRRRRDLREPPERDGGCGRALPQGRQCRDPARRLGELPFRARDPCGAGRGLARRRSCPRMRSSWCRRATAPRSD